MKFKVIVSSLLMAVMLAGCGGGGGSAGTTTGGSGAGPITNVASDFSFELSASQLSNSGADSVLLTVTAVNLSRNVVTNVPVSVSVDSGVFTPASAVTDASGRYSGSITIGGNRDNRTISATITINGIVKTASVQVIGSQLSVTAIPANPTPGGLVTLNITATNASATGIANAPITLSGNALGTSVTVNTDAAGNAVRTFMAPATSGSYTVTAAGLGVSSSRVIQVVSSTNPTVPAAVGPLSSASVTPQQASILPNTAGSTTNRSRLSARFLNAGNGGIANVRVRFEIEAPFLGSGESISTQTSTVFSDSTGTAEADYISGVRTSPTNGVLIKACYSLTDFTPEAPCPAFVRANLTVASQPLSITISNNNTLQSGLGGIAYIQQFLIQVSDSAGAAVRDAVVSTSVNITHFGKGTFEPRPYQRFDNRPPTLSDTYVTTLSATDTPSAAGRVWCLNEDSNRNGSLDVLPIVEDINSNGRLEPRQAEIIVSFVSGNRTDVNGQMLIQVSYGQNVGTWLAFTLRATTNVAGSEGLSERAFVTSFLEGDLVNGSFRTPPYGTGRCVDPN